MAMNPDIRDQAYQFFIEEAGELLQVLESALLTVRQERSTSKVHDLMRAAHSIKGGAASVGLETIKTLAHRLEDIFKALYNEEVKIDTELEGWLLDAYDCLKEPLLSQIEIGEFDAQEALDNANPVFSKIEQRLGDALTRADDYIPSSTDLGIDIVSSIFEVDVAQGLERLTNVVTNPAQYEIAGEIRAQAEVFAGFAELLNLPGFGEIAEITLAALELHPERALEIANLMLADYQAAREVVLAGDRLRGGSPSATLVFLSQRASEVDEVDKIVLDSQSQVDISSQIDSETPVSFLDEVFGSTFEELELEITETSVTSPTEEIETAAPSLDEVFGSTFEEVELELTETSVTSPTEEIEIPAPSLDEVFSSAFKETELELAETSVTLPNKEIETQVPSLDEVFSSAFEETELELAETSVASQTEEIGAEETLPDTVTEPTFISEIDESLTEAQKAAQIDSEEEVELLTFLAESEASKAPETLEETVQSIEQIFAHLPSLQDISAPASEQEPQVAADPATIPAKSKLLSQPNLDQKSPASKSVRKAANQSDKKSTAKRQQVENRSPSSLSVRVDLNRLERMNNLVGELAINRNSLSLQNDQVQAGVRELINRFVQFKDKTGKLQEISDKILISLSNYGRENLRRKDKQIGWSQTNESQNTLAGESEFDSLEMDNYGVIYSALQELIEDIMQLEESVDDIVLFARQSNQTIDKQRQMLTYLRDELMWARMLPIGEILNRFPRVLRDLSTKYNKPVSLKIHGTGVLVDKAVLEKLYDPLLHLLRNAFDHGIESPEIRRQQGKPEQGSIEVIAYHQGNQTFIEIKDDGRGLNLEKIARQAVELGWLSSEQLAATSKASLLEFIFQPGFSTARQVSELSGRGVGLDVVRSQIQYLKGNVSVSSSPGEGTTFTLRLPLTLTISKLLVCLIGATAIALPSDTIEEIIIPKADQIKKSGTEEFLYWHNQIIPTYKIKELLDYNCPLPDTPTSEILSAMPTPEDWALPLLILRQGQQLFALEVDRIVTEQELVIKPFGPALAPPSYIYGCTILGDGSLVSVINGSVLLSFVLGPTKQEREQIFESTIQDKLSDHSSSGGKIASTDNKLKVTTVLIVDDSSALRKTLAFTLQKAGYRVLQARDGREALDKLEQTSVVELVICDIEMPNMNGFEFLSVRRQDPQLSQIPVAMLTSRSSNKHRQLAIQLGASAYFSKPYVEQQFLAALKDIISQNQPKTISASR
ncbi:MAG: response regulator [Prochloraceae cyanobacterium]